MAETRVFKSRGGLRHALGLSSLVLSLCSGVLFLMLLVLTRAAKRAMTSPVTGEMDAPGFAPLAIFLGFVCLPLETSIATLIDVPGGRW